LPATVRRSAVKHSGVCDAASTEIPVADRVVAAVPPRLLEAAAAFTPEQAAATALARDADVDGAARGVLRPLRPRRRCWPAELALEPGGGGEPYNLSSGNH
jgi:hypothetical protein